MTGTGFRRYICARYTNSNWHAAAIVAVLTMQPNADGTASNEIFDWTAYWGGADWRDARQTAVELVAANGDKLSSVDAFHFFPELSQELYRE